MEMTRDSNLLRPFDLPPKAVVEFIVVFTALATADPTQDSLIVGAAVSIAGLLLRVWTAGYGYNVGELTIRGPYRFVRHPYLLGSGLLFIGICLGGRQVWVNAGALLMLIAVYRIDVQRDERRLEKRLGPRFQEFRERVPAYIPALIPEWNLPTDGHRFSLGMSLLRGRHRELNSLIWLGGVFGLMFLCSRLPDKSLFHLGMVVAGLLVIIGRFFVAHSRRRMGIS